MREWETVKIPKFMFDVVIFKSQILSLYLFHREKKRKSYHLFYVYQWNLYVTLAPFSFILSRLFKKKPPAPLYNLIHWSQLYRFISVNCCGCSLYKLVFSDQPLFECSLSLFGAILCFFLLFFLMSTTFPNRLSLCCFIMSHTHNKNWCGNSTKINMFSSPYPVQDYVSLYICTTFPPPPSQLDKLSVIKFFWFSSNPELAGYKTLVKEKNVQHIIYILCVYRLLSPAKKKKCFLLLFRKPTYIISFWLKMSFCSLLCYIRRLSNKHDE